MRLIDTILWGCRQRIVSLNNRLPFLFLQHYFNRPKAIYDPEHKFIYVNVPKVANRSIKIAIAEHIGLSCEYGPHKANWNYKKISELNEQTDYFRFAFVRNPLDRLLSCYAQKIVLYGKISDEPLQFWKYGKLFHREMSFADFVKLVAKIPDCLSDRHFRSQHTFLCHKDNIMVDFLGHFENLEKDWNKVRNSLGFGELPHENKSHHETYPDVYTRELAQIAAERYEKDIELFGYGREVASLTASL